MNNIKRTIGLVTIFGWPVLGFNRGFNSYNYHYSNNKLYQNSDTKQYLYTDAFMWGVGSTLAYLNPFLCFITIGKEIYRLEVNLRGLENEKKTAYYNTVL
jgi:hypothetical protein